MEQEKQQKEITEEITNFGKLKKILTRAFKPNNEILTADKANILSNCKINAVNSSYLTTRVKELLSDIKIKAETNPEDKMICINIPKNQEFLYKGIKDYFSDLGYSTFYVDRSNIPEMKDNIYLFISWDLN